MTDSLTSFKYFDSFNLILFSRTRDNRCSFLLRKKTKTSLYTHFSGNFFNQEPSIILALAKKFIRQTGGLLCSQNFKQFSRESSIIRDPEAVHMETCPKGPRPLTTLSQGLNDICRLVCESPYFFQDDSNTATYFVEIPMLDIERIEQFAELKGKNYQFKYFSLEEMIETNTKEVTKTLQTVLEESQLLSYIKKYIVGNETIEITGLYGIICCEMFVKTHMLHALNYPIFKKHGERWRFYRAFENDLPTDDDFKILKGLIIPGSSCSAYNSNVDWYHGLFGVIRKICYHHPSINLLGVCFGAQIIAQALGGKVEKMNREFIDCGETLTLKPDFFELPCVKSAKLDKSQPLVIAQAHNDQIVELPANAKHYGSSENTNVEIFGINNNILAFQGHPDYNEVMVVRSSFKNKKLSGLNYSKYEETCINSKFSSPLTLEEIQRVCFNFLKQDH